MKTHHFLMLAFLGMLGRTWSDDAAKTPLALKPPLVVITQIVEHDALTKEREGIIQALKDAGFEDGKTITIKYQNDQGNIAMASKIAACFANKQPNVADDISTPSDQYLVQRMEKKE